MTSPEPAYRPHLVEDVPDNSPLGIWERQANDHNAHRELLRLRNQIAEMRRLAHRDYIEEMQRQAQRVEAENAVASARWPQSVPGMVLDHIQEAAQDAPEPTPEPRGVRWPEDESRTSKHANPQDMSWDIQDRARALFRAMPDASREKVKNILGCTEYDAKKLCAAKDEILAGAR